MSPNGLGASLAESGDRAVEVKVPMREQISLRMFFATLVFLVACGTLRAQPPPPVHDLRLQPSTTTMDVAAAVRGVFNSGNHVTQSSSVTRSGRTIIVEHVIGFIGVGVPPPPQAFGITLGLLPEGVYSVLYRAHTTDGSPYAVQDLQLLVLGDDVNYPAFDLRVEPSPAAVGTPAILRGWFVDGHRYTLSSSVTRDGNVINVGHVIGFVGSGIPPAAQGFDISLGPLPAGNYSVVYRPLGGFPWPARTLPLVVLGSAVLAVPTLSALSGLVLVVLMLALGLWGFGRLR